SFASNLKDIFSSYSEIPHKALIDDPKGFHKYSKIITEVLKTMKDLGMSYKFGLLHEVGFVNFVTASEITNYPEHFVHILMRYEELREIYFSRSPNKKQLNPGTMQRIDGSLSHAILYAAFFNGVIRSADGALSDLRSLMGQTDKSGFNHWILGVLASKSNIPKHDKADAEKAKKILISFGSHLHALESTKFKEDLSSVLTKLSTDSEKLRLIQSNVVSDILRDVNIHRIILDSHIKYYNQWLKQAPLPASCPNHLRDHLLKTCESILGVVQAYVKLMDAVEVRQAMNEEMSVLKVDVLMRSLKALASLSSFEPRLRLSSIEPLLNTYASMIESFKIRCQGVAFKHPPEEEDKDEDKQGGDDKGPKEGCGLGEGTGTDNVSSEIPDEDMLEGAERPEDQEKQEEKDDEENGPKEDDGIEMADDFDDGKFEPQEKDEKEEEGSENEEEKEELDQKEEDVEEDTELDDDLWKDEEKDEEPEDKSTEKDDQVTEDRKDQTQKSQANREHRDNKNKPQDPEEEDNPEVNEQEEQEEEDDPDEKRKDLDDSENDETEEEEKRKREDEEFSDGEELDLDVLDDKKLDEHEPEDLNMDDMNIEDDNDEEMPDMTKDDLEDYDKPDFEDPEFDLDEDKTEEAGGDFSENDPKENASNIPEGSKNETLEEDTAVNNQDSIDGSNMDAESQEQDSTPQPQNVQPNKEKSKANEKSKASKDNQDVKDVEIAHKDEKEESKRDDESKAHDNLPEEEEREEDPSVVETMDHKQLKDHSGKEKEEDKEEEDNKMDVDDVANPMPKIEDENLLPTHGAERPNDSFFSSGQPLAVGAANMPASTSLIPVTSEPLRPISFSSQSAKEWSETLGETSSLSQNLISKLRLLFEPTKANRLKGDYKAGKRLNMRKIIPYIASHFGKTRFGSREPNMSDNDASKMAIQALATVSQAFNVLEVGKLDGARIIEGFQFAQSKTSILSLIEESSAAFVRCGAEVSNSLSQLLVIISDGKEELLASLRRAASLNIFIMFVIVETGRDSILDIRFPVFDDGHNLLRIESYMDNFPFNYYILLKDMISLPTTLCGALQQWFEMSQFK
ncbi:Midasin, partial [Caligus rogercresseyi]